MFTLVRLRAAPRSARSSASVTQSTRTGGEEVAHRVAAGAAAAPRRSAAQRDRIDRVQRLDVVRPSAARRRRRRRSRAEQEADDVGVEPGHVAGDHEHVRVAARQHGGVDAGERPAAREAVARPSRTSSARKRSGRLVDTITCGNSGVEETDGAHGDRLAADGGERLVASAHARRAAAGEDDARRAGARSSCGRA